MAKLNQMSGDKIRKKAQAGLIGDRKMQVVHLREDYGVYRSTTSECGHTGVHTTTKDKLVSCIYCRALIERKARIEARING